MITGPGIKMSMTKDIDPGQSATLAVTLKKGAYDIFCPIPGHKALGMNVNIFGQACRGRVISAALSAHLTAATALKKKRRRVASPAEIHAVHVWAHVR